MISILPLSKKYHETATASGKESIPNIFTTRRMQRKTLQKTGLSLVILIGETKNYVSQSVEFQNISKAVLYSCVQLLCNNIYYIEICWEGANCVPDVGDFYAKYNPQTQRQVCRITCRRKTPQNVQLFFKPINFTISSIVHPYNSL